MNSSKRFRRSAARFSRNVQSATNPSVISEMSVPSVPLVPSPPEPSMRAISASASATDRSSPHSSKME